ncbi:MAG: hypothetical protein AABZ55_16070 [Bdellovibrionota bacterium]
MKPISLFLRIISTTALVGYLLLSNPARASENPIFGYPHLLPSPYTMRAGRLVIGSDAAFGLTDFIQISSNVILDIYQTYNAQVKLSLLDYPEFALALTGGWVSFNYSTYSLSNPNIQVTSWLPGFVSAVSIHPSLAAFFGGNLSISKSTLTTQTIETSGYIRGASGEVDLSWAYNPHKKSLGNVLSTGVTYDFSYQIYGVGVSHYWRGFHLGIHYYPNAKTYRVLPIISGSMALDI